MGPLAVQLRSCACPATNVSAKWSWFKHTESLTRVLTNPFLLPSFSAEQACSFSAGQASVPDKLACSCRAAAAEPPGMLTQLFKQCKPRQATSRHTARIPSVNTLYAAHPLHCNGCGSLLTMAGLSFHNKSQTSHTSIPCSEATPPGHARTPRRSYVPPHGRAANPVSCRMRWKQGQKRSWVCPWRSSEPSRTLVASRTTRAHMYTSYVQEQPS